ncbi:helix-turn-helix transcriptional regulator [Paracoccus laeviglucosivorans]|uniref:LuxR family transcriptional regulator n=1 Tax=Paracoccus laeviglucosivorans TaxID=1197861 RepID=A0A521FCD6_9RHOB|nr:autoinducer binding domain-containing protein [Paracoccus laeviglucosivorans]SMO93867.1 LuxR family transcriptional regulator [Paracoccus laeviglucosivorans]
MLPTLIPSYDENVQRIADIAKSGWTFAHRYNWSGPMHFESRYPQAWINKYQSNLYQVCDPVVFWICKPHMREFRSTRWSEMSQIIDVRGVMEGASRFGLKYGAAFTRRVDKLTVSFMTVARSDRELTDGEMDVLGATFHFWVDTLEQSRPILSEAEIEAIRYLRDGLAQGDIAASLEISESAVKKRITGAMNKLHAQTRPQAVALSIAHRLI